MTTNYCLNTESILTAILHDIVENIDFTLAMITQELGSAIVQKVGKLTNLNIDHSISTMETINRMREEKATDLLIIKLLDNLHDMQTIRQSDVETKRSSFTKFKKFSAFSGVYRATGDRIKS